MAESGEGKGQTGREGERKKGVGGSDEENMRLIPLRSEMFQRNPIERLFTLCPLKMLPASLFGVQLPQTTAVMGH